MCKVSVIVPTYNVEAYLRECMDSIVGQTLSEIEIICINDGSTDHSGKILQEYAAKDCRVRVIEQENRGYGYTVNIGIHSARGAYVSIIEPDDYIEKRMYEELYAVAFKYSLDFIKGDYAVFKGNKLCRSFDRIMICPRLSWYGRVLHPDLMPELLDVEMMNVTGIYRRAFLLDAGITLQETPGALYQDTGMWFQVFTKAKRCMFVPKKYYNIRRDNPNSSIVQTEKLAKICNEYENCYHRLTQDRESYFRFAPYLFKRKVYIYIFILDKVNCVDRSEIMKRFSRDVQDAIEKHEYTPSMFTRSIQRFLTDVRDWTEGESIPVYIRRASFWGRIRECLQEHGAAYTVRRIFIKAGLKQDIF